MNLPLVVSYIIAGIIMLSIVAMNISISKSSTELTLTQITREKASAVTEFISQDLQKMGYNQTKRTEDVITQAQEDKITFHSNIDNSDNNSVEVITWHFTGDEIPATPNPDDRALIRTVHDQSGGLKEKTAIELGVTGLKISYYDEYGEALSESLVTPVADPTKIKQIYLQLKFESPEKMYYQVGGDGKYILSVWEKRFSPPNLDLN